MIQRTAGALVFITDERDVEGGYNRSRHPLRMRDGQSPGIRRSIGVDLESIGNVDVRKVDAGCRCWKRNCRCDLKWGRGGCGTAYGRAKSDRRDTRCRACGIAGRGIDALDAKALAG